MNGERLAWRWLAVLVAVWVVMLLLRLLPLGGVWRDIAPTTLVALAAWVLAFAVGYAVVVSMAGRVQQQPLAEHWPAHWRARWILTFSVLATLGAVLIGYEFAFNRGYGFDTPVSTIRVNEVEGAQSGGGGSAISGIGRMLTPLLLLAWALLASAAPKLRRSEVLAVAVATVVVLGQQTLFEGGRFFLATLLCAGALARTGGRPRPARNARKGRALGQRLAWAAVAMAALLTFAWVFLDRAAAIELDLVGVFSLFSDSYALELTRDLSERLSGDTGSIWFVLAMFWAYITQGPNELDVVLALADLTHAHGLYQFPQMGPILARVAGIDAGYDVFNHLPNPGTYLTMFGAAWVDFGVAGALAQAVVLGALTSRSLLDVLRGRPGGLALGAPLLLCVALFAPIVSLLTTVWPALVAAWLVGATLPRRTRRSGKKSHLARSIQSPNTPSVTSL